MVPCFRTAAQRQRALAISVRFANLNPPNTPPHPSNNKGVISFAEYISYALVLLWYIRIIYFYLYVKHSLHSPH